MSAPTLYVDADACPVKDEAARVAERHKLALVMVSNGGVRPSAFPTARIVVVGQGPDEADRWIADQIQPHDVCVTADIPLAARCVEAGATALKPNGEVFTQKSVGQALATRDLMADLRAADPLGLSTGGGPKPFARADRARFLDALERVVQTAMRARR